MSRKDKKLYIILFIGFDLFLVVLGTLAGQNEMPYWIRLLAINSMGLMMGVLIGGIWAEKKKYE